MRYLSLFSGIESAALAWQSLGWTPAAFAEIDPFCLAVLCHHWPAVPNLGDVRHISEAHIRALAPIDLVVFGFPCQDLSVAGQRRGLEYDGKKTRSGLFFDAARIVRWLDPRWVVAENVPGLLGHRHNAFGRVLAELVGADAPLVPPGGRRWSDTGLAAGPRRTVAWRILDAQHFGVPQRRRRLFLVSGRAGDYRPAAVLFEPESVRRDSPPCRAPGESVASPLGGGTPSRGWHDDLDRAGAFVCQCQGGNTSSAGEVGTPRSRNGGVTDAAPIVFTETGPSHFSDGVGVLASHEAKNPSVLVFDWQAAGADNDTSFRGGSRKDIVRHGGHAGALSASRVDAVMLPGSLTVRRLLPVECERLMGFPDHFTLVPFRDKSAPDSRRYAAIGNSIAVPVLRWLGERVALAEQVVAWPAKNGDTATWEATRATD